MAETQKLQKWIEIPIAGELTVLQTADLKNRLFDALNKSEGIKLIFQELSGCDSLGIQLLCTTHKTAEKLGKTMVLGGDTDRIIDMAGRMGMPVDECFCVDQKEENGQCQN